jgi:hypothetical protein
MYQQAAEPNEFVFSGWVKVGAPDPGIKDACAPAVTSWREGRLDVVVCGNDDRCWYNVYDRNVGAWSGWEGFDGVISSGPAFTSYPSSRVDIFARATDGGLAHWCPSTMPPGQKENLGGQFVGAPAAVSWGEGRLDVFVVNINGEVWWYWSEG